MIPNYYKQLVQILKSKTEMDRCFWSRTSLQDQYKLILNNGMVVLSFKTSSKGNDIKLDIYNETGTIVDSISVNSQSNITDYSDLLQLYNVVRKRKEDNVSRVISNLITEIQSGCDVGKKETFK